MTLTTLPPVLESAVEKMAVAIENKCRDNILMRRINSVNDLFLEDKERLLSETTKIVFVFLNALLADGKARISEVHHRDRSKPPGCRIIIPLEPLP